MKLDRNYVDLRSILSTILMSVAIFLRDGNLVSWYVPLIILAVIFVVQIQYSIEFDEWAVYKEVFVLFVVPYLCALLYTLIGALWIESFRFTLTRCISLVIQFALIFFVTTGLHITYREKGIEILGNAMILCYAYCMINAILHIGISGVFQYLIDPGQWQSRAGSIGYSNYLEWHDLGAAVGMVAVYEIFINEKRKLSRIILLLFVMYSCHKRIEILAFFAALLIGMILYKRWNDSNAFISMGFTVILASCFVYIVLVGSGLIYTLVGRLGLSLSGRIGLFNSVSQFYYLSPLFSGKGFGFTEKYLGAIAGTDYAYRLGNAWMGKMHNDILRLYIELGAIGSFMWYFWNLKVISNKLMKQMGMYAKYVYFIMCVYAYISYTMDNTMDYMVFQFSLFCILITSCYKSAVSDVNLQYNVSSIMVGEWENS